VRWYNTHWGKVIRLPASILVMFLFILIHVFMFFMTLYLATKEFFKEFGRVYGEGYIDVPSDWECIKETIVGDWTNVEGQQEKLWEDLG